MCLQRSHSPGEHLSIRSQQSSAALVRCIFYIYSLKNFHENFQKLETGQLSTTVVISSACWVILFRLLASAVASPADQSRRGLCCDRHPGLKKWSYSGVPSPAIIYFFICFLCSCVYSPAGSWALCTVREHAVVFVHVPGLHRFFTALRACLQMLGIGSVRRKQRDRLRPEHHLLHLLHFHNAHWWRLPELLPGKEKPPPPFSIFFLSEIQKNRAVASSMPTQCVEFSVIYVFVCWHDQELCFFLYNSSLQELQNVFCRWFRLSLLKYFKPVRAFWY